MIKDIYFRNMVFSSSKPQGGEKEGCRGRGGAEQIGIARIVFSSIVQFQHSLSLVLYISRIVYLYYCKVLRQFIPSLVLVLYISKIVYIQHFISSRIVYLQYCIVLGQFIYSIVQFQDSLSLALYSSRIVYLQYCTSSRKVWLKIV